VVVTAFRVCGLSEAPDCFPDSASQRNLSWAATLAVQPFIELHARDLVFRAWLTRLNGKSSASANSATFARIFKKLFTDFGPFWSASGPQKFSQAAWRAPVNRIVNRHDTPAFSRFHPDYFPEFGRNVFSTRSGHHCIAARKAICPNVRRSVKPPPVFNRVSDDDGVHHTSLLTKNIAFGRAFWGRFRHTSSNRVISMFAVLRIKWDCATPAIRRRASRYLQPPESAL